ncbi:Ankyrin repeat domain-containing protein 44 [Phytophthora pseudosyringae]|uniref:Ankyrin repeat domain-containing protein 44 n=1 Tax=Phytophthora pseudosyringae TaxID=221518 RepID=A0A8T1W121_9STRA|nr:Ankyrin repeat domain-containing protein 44 [Phytophthora pseudosyringae]
MQGAQPPPELLAYRALQAVQQGNAEELAKLIQAGANAHVINAVVKTGTSPNGRPDREGKGGLLYHAVEKENVELVKVLLGNGAEVNGSKQDETPPPLRAAVMRKNIELVTLLLKRGANVNRKYGITADSGKLITTVLFETTSDAVYGLLLRRGGDANGKDSRGDTPLHVHAEKWNASFVNELVQHGADVNALDKENRTPLVRAIQQWGFRPGCDEEEDFIDVCHNLMSHNATPPLADSITSKPENAEQLLWRLQSVKEWGTQRTVGMAVLSHLPVEIYRRGVTEIAAYFASNTLVPVATEQSEIRTEALPEGPRRQSKNGLAAWTLGDEVLQRKVEILPALDRSLSSRAQVPSSDDITPFPGRQEPEPMLNDLEYRPKRNSNAAWLVREDLAPVDQLSPLSESRVNTDDSPVIDVVAAATTEKPAEVVKLISSVAGPEAALYLKNAAADPPSQPPPAGPVVSDAKPALPPVSTRSGLPVVAPLHLYRLKIMCATGLRRAIKIRRQNPYCVCRLVRGDGEALLEVQTSVHPGGGQVPTWRGQVFELALTPENTRTCTLVFVLKHSGVVASLDERIAVGMMPFPHIPIGHSLTHKLLLMNNDTVAGRLEIHLEAY